VSGDKLSALQWRILFILAELRPPFTLTGGAALAGIHLRHRETRDLDLFWREHPELGDLVTRVGEMLRAADLEVSTVQEATTFHRLRVADTREICLVDLVAEPFAALEKPTEVQLDRGVVLLVDTPHEILANKLCTLLSRSELRDLVDVKALLDAGGNLERGLADAARKDGGFSPLTLAWVLRSLRVSPLAQALGWPEEQTAELVKFHGELIELLTSGAAPE